MLATALCCGCADGGPSPFPLQDAASQNAAGWLDRFVKEGNDPTAPDDRGFTPLHVAATVRIATRLLELGAPADPVADDGTTPLHSAVLFERASLVRLLVKRGANVHATDAEGWQPVHYAAASSDPRNLRTLLKAGADPKVRTTDGALPIEIARRFENHRCVRLLER